MHTLSVTVDVAFLVTPPGLPATHYGVPVVLTWDGLYGFGGLDAASASSRATARVCRRRLTVPSLDDGNGRRHACHRSSPP